jgi:hypothetical protein
MFLLTKQVFYQAVNSGINNPLISITTEKMKPRFNKNRSVGCNLSETSNYEMSEL